MKHCESHGAFPQGRACLSGNHLDSAESGTEAAWCLPGKTPKAHPAGRCLEIHAAGQWPRICSVCEGTAATSTEGSTATHRATWGGAAAPTTPTEDPVCVPPGQSPQPGEQTAHSRTKGLSVLPFPWVLASGGSSLEGGEAGEGGAVPWPGSRESEALGHSSPASSLQRHTG